MKKELQIQVSPEEAHFEDQLLEIAARELKLSSNRILHLNIKKRSIDARKRKVKINLLLEVYVDEKFNPQTRSKTNFQEVHNAESVIVIGAGPAGLFAALRLIELGLKPIIVERGKNVRERRRDLAAITRFHTVDPDSNYCFGEGGAGTYSDGKLYTRSKKRGDVNRILQLLIEHGADENIAIDAHPHIGTNKLPKLIANIRQTILEWGGEILFNTRVVDLLIKEKQITGVRTQNNDKIEARKVILATGHSARDIFELLYRKNIKIEAKPFALGVRVEHSQQLIDQIQYHCDARGDYLPAAAYSVVKQVKNRGVYSFCMCPGGVIAPCATAPGEVVTNGWSPSKRDQPSSNSGIVVELSLDDFKPYLAFGPLAGVEFQKQIEQTAWKLGGETQRVPAQRLIDFTQGKTSKNIPQTSYIPGTTSVELGEVLPPFIYKSLQEGFKLFGQSMRGYLTNDAVVHAPESRTSSPVRIPRDRNTLEHIEIKGLFPCGEGAGYAGGIISAAIDGEKCAEQVAIGLGVFVPE
ncbi:NAD(P)/FAD-dependent oxidoreductase [Namhaeicola litoreus]|uniref:NAD(P)/FAD-dependent oxidoreductase n=1 Tax=Namhaeicola litoreus TaxID=1052145 RepID=A0ABW3Y203_9FLAO